MIMTSKASHQRKNRVSSAVALCAGLAGAAAIALSLAPALAASGAPTAFKGFGNSKDPIQIEADTMNVATPDQLVTFEGGVTVHQKDSTLVTQHLKVFYDNNAQAGSQPAAAATAAGAPNAQLRRFEAAGGLKITEPDQSVTGDSGWFDMASQKAEVDGNVVLTHGKDVARACKLLINLKSGEYKLDRCSATGKIQMLLNPGSNDGAAAPAKPK
jgi:lipopolysaccharide export system protein LptA